MLALDTTTRAGSAALVDDGASRPSARRRGAVARRAAARRADRARRGARSAMAAVNLFAVAAGPGSFTGLRIGIATMQGLAFVAGRPLSPCRRSTRWRSSVGVAAARHDRRRLDGRAARRGVRRAATAWRGRPFTPERLVELEEAAVGAPGDTAARWRARPSEPPSIVIGDGAVRYRDAFAEAAGRPDRRAAAARRRDRPAGRRARRAEAPPSPPSPCARSTSGAPTRSWRARRTRDQGSGLGFESQRDTLAHRTRRVGRAARRAARDRAGVVHEPVDARDVPRRAAEPRRLVLLSRAGARGERSGSARSGSSSTSSTSTTSRCSGSPAGRRHGAAGPVLAERGARGGARHARSAAIERRAQALYERFGFAVAGVRRATIRSRSRTRSCCGRRAQARISLRGLGPCATFRLTRRPEFS